MASRFLPQFVDLGVMTKKWSQGGGLDFHGLMINSELVIRISVIVGYVYGHILQV